MLESDRAGAVRAILEAPAPAFLVVEGDEPSPGLAPERVGDRWRSYRR